jgi:hypothetical protein
MARKTIKRSRRLYINMDKRKRRTRRKMRRKHRTKRLNKKGGACFGCVSRLREYYLYDTDNNQVHQTPIALTPDKAQTFKNSGFRVVEAPKQRRK